MEGEKDSILPSVGEEQKGGLHIGKRERRGVVKRDVDPYVIKSRDQAKKERWKVQNRIGPA